MSSNKWKQVWLIVLVTALCLMPLSGAFSAEKDQAGNEVSANKVGEDVKAASEMNEEDNKEAVDQTTEREQQANDIKQSLKEGDEQIVLSGSSKTSPGQAQASQIPEDFFDEEDFDEAMTELAKARRASARRVPVNYQTYRYSPETTKSLGTETLLSKISKEAAGKIFYELKEEGGANLTARVAVVGAVPLSDLKRESEFGRVVAEYLLTDLADRGLWVTELRLGKEISILPQTGEFILTRNIGELANDLPELEYVVISTFTNTRKTLILQGRLVSLKDGMVKTSWRHSLPLNRELLGLFQSSDKPLTIAVKGMM